MLHLGVSRTGTHRAYEQPTIYARSTYDRSSAFSLRQEDIELACGQMRLFNVFSRFAPRIRTTLLLGLEMDASGQKEYAAYAESQQCQGLAAIDPAFP